MVRSLIILATLAVAACSGGGGGNAAAPDNFAPPATQPPRPVAGQAQTTPLTVYVGHYPRDAVDGVGFYDRTEVSNAVIALIPEERGRRLVTSRDATTTPIFARGGLVASHGCEAHNCADLNWTVLVSPDADPDRATVCYHDAERMGAASRWTTRAGSQRRPGECPSA